MSKPYKEQINNGIKYREFDPMVESDELVWHRDKQGRIVTVIEGNGWMFQMDNDVPIELEEGDEITIPKMEYHRLYKAGTTPLKISIKEKYMKTFKEFNEAKSEKELDIQDIEQMIKKPDPSRFKQYGGKAKYIKMLKDKLAKLKESTELEEAAYYIDTSPWSYANAGKKPKGKGMWAFEYIASLPSGGTSGLQKDRFFSKAMSTYKDAVKQLSNFLKKELGVKPKDVKIKVLS